MSSLKLKAANIVVLANSFNPSVATKDWLLQNVIGEEPVDYMLTPVVVVFKTEKIELLVDQSRLQAVCKQMDDENLASCSHIISSYVEKLPHTPYKAVGLNYVFDLPLQSDILQKRLTEVLGNLNSAFTHFSVGPSIIGIKEDNRIQINVDPSLDPSIPVQVRVNYHYDCAEWQTVIRRVNSFTDVSKDSAELVYDVLFKGGSNVN